MNFIIALGVFNGVGLHSGRFSSADGKKDGVWMRGRSYACGGVELEYFYWAYEDWSLRRDTIYSG